MPEESQKVSVISAPSGEDYAADFHQRGEINGQDVHYSLLQGSRPVQQDRAVVMKLAPDAVQEKGVRNYAPLIREIIQDMAEAAAEKQSELERDKAEPDKAYGDTTVSIALYNPKKFTLDIGSIGDSPVFALLKDNNKTVAVRLSSTADGVPGTHMLTNSLLTRSDAPRIHEGIYQLPGREAREGKIFLEDFMRDACKAHGLNRSEAQLSFLISSDGILKLTEKEIAALFHQKQEGGNFAQTLNEEAINRGGDDNCVSVLIENVEKDKGGRIAACVCDGFNKYPGLAPNQKKGHVIAEAAANEFEKQVSPGTVIDDPGLSSPGSQHTP